jgi:hypothetical protein
MSTCAVNRGPVAVTWWPWSLVPGGRDLVPGGRDLVPGGRDLVPGPRPVTWWPLPGARALVAVVCDPVAWCRWPRSQVSSPRPGGRDPWAVARALVAG